MTRRRMMRFRRMTRTMGDTRRMRMTRKMRRRRRRMKRFFFAKILKINKYTSLPNLVRPG